MKTAKTNAFKKTIAFKLKVFMLLVFITTMMNFAKAQSPSSSNTLGSTGITSIGSTTAAPFQLSANGAVKLYGTGNGIGTSSGVTTSPTLFLQNTSTGAKEYLINSDNSGLLRISDMVEGTSFTATDRLVINSSGLIGIGNSSPSARLHITGTGTSSSSTSLLIENSSNANLFTVRDDGRVGIGTASPTQALEIAGNVRINATGTSPLAIITANILNPQFEIVNSINANGAGCGYAAANNVGSSVQLSIASSGNVYIPNGAWVRCDGTGGLSLVVNGGGPIMFTPSLTAGSTSEWGRFSTTGKFGLGERAPTEKLDVVGNVKFSGALMPANLPGSSGQVLTSAGAGTAPTWTTPLTVSSVWLLGGNSGTSPSTNYIGTSDGQPVVFRTSGSEKMRIDASGKIGINTNSPQYLMDINGIARVVDKLIIGNDTYAFPTGDYRLSVKDGIITERLKIRLRANWPDYVFDENHNLPELSEVEKYINRNKHLSGIQSAEDVRTNGIEIGEMNAKLVEKIEELTRYMINADKQIHQLQEQVKLISKRN